MQTILINKWLKKWWISALVVLISFGKMSYPSISNVYPIFAQQNYENPHEATGRIVCANCHLAKKPVDIEAPQSVLPDTVFEAIPPPPDRILAKIKEKLGRLSFQSYRPGKDNIIVVGPVCGKLYNEIVFLILSPNPDTNKDVHFLKYPIYVGGNRGRGQIYPDGSKRQVKKVVRKEKGGYEITIDNSSENCKVIDIVPPGPELIVSEGESVKVDQPLTNNPNVGGFGQGEVFLVLQKKQFEKVQLAEMNF
ncbi:hypothetical protein KP509_16G060400 [Ceratopteris richardii]|uniref:Cytochrome f n=1 Tax=Ceratopteris richardii TaxID=49495 RepID=A0A8T2T3F1_CERRI|nr:hypothetical protein KP509_16G060400 [Ceratopteris richardii]